MGAALGLGSRAIRRDSSAWSIPRQVSASRLSMESTRGLDAAERKNIEYKFVDALFGEHYAHFVTERTQPNVSLQPPYSPRQRSHRTRDVWPAAGRHAGRNAATSAAAAYVDRGFYLVNQDN